MRLTDVIDEAVLPKKDKKVVPVVQSQKMSAPKTEATPPKSPAKKTAKKAPVDQNLSPVQAAKQKAASGNKRPTKAAQSASSAQAPAQAQAQKKPAAPAQAQTQKKPAAPAQAQAQAQTEPAQATAPANSSPEIEKIKSVLNKLSKEQLTALRNLAVGRLQQKSAK